MIFFERYYSIIEQSMYLCYELFMKKHNQIIKKIENVRKKNNVQWMNILRIAIKSSPKDTNKVIKKINSNDKAISKLVSSLSKLK